MNSPLRFVLISLTFIFLVAINVAAATPTGSKHRITEAEFLRLVKADKSISNRTVLATSIIKALLWTQEQKALNKPLPSSIALDDCLVEGPFGFYEGLQWFEDPRPGTIGAGPRFPRVSLNEFSVLLKETPIDKLSDEISKHYKSVGIEKVIVIPVGLSFTDTKFQSDSSFTFVHSVFEGEVTFDSVDFGATDVRFDNSTFTQQTLFESCNFNGEVTFASATFHAITEFNGSKFKNTATFDEADFEDSVIFNSLVGSEIRFDGVASFDKVSIKTHMSFVFVTFADRPSFAEASITGGLDFDSCKIAGNAFFTDLNKDSGSRTGRLRFFDTTFSERAYFNNASVNEILFSYQSGESKDTGERLARASSPVVFGKHSTFTGLDCNRANFHAVEFRDYADFSATSFAKHVDFSNAIFEGGASFYTAQFPRRGPPEGDGGTPGLVVEGVQFLKGVTLDWSQIQGSLKSGSPDTFKRLENAFKQSGDLEGQNEAMYQRKFLEGTQSGWWKRLTNWLDFAFWGYGVRPLRLLGWMLIVLVVFTIVYWTQTAELVQGKHKLKDAWRRLRFALAFSLRTSWTLGFGYTNSRTTIFKILTMVHSIGFKILVLCLLQAFANTSPLLNQLVGKLIHV